MYTQRGKNCSPFLNSPLSYRLLNLVVVSWMMMSSPDERGTGQGSLITYADGLEKNVCKTMFNKLSTHGNTWKRHHISLFIPICDLSTGYDNKQTKGDDGPLKKVKWNHEDCQERDFLDFTWVVLISYPEYVLSVRLFVCCCKKYNGCRFTYTNDERLRTRDKLCLVYLFASSICRAGTITVTLKYMCSLLH